MPRFYGYSSEEMVGEDEVDIIAELEKLDRFLDGTEPGEIPRERLRASGMEIPDDDAELDDGRLHATLREMLDTPVFTTEPQRAQRRTEKSTGRMKRSTCVVEVSVLLCVSVALW